MLELYRDWQVDNAESMEFIYRRSIERVLGCVENMAGPDCELGFLEKLRRTREMICAEEAGKALKLSRPRSAMMKLMLIPVRMKCGR